MKCCECARMQYPIITALLGISQSWPSALQYRTPFLVSKEKCVSLVTASPNNMPIASDASAQASCKGWQLDACMDKSRSVQTMPEELAPLLICSMACGTLCPKWNITIGLSTFGAWESVEMLTPVLLSSLSLTAFKSSQY